MLQKQPVPINFAQGINTKVDPKQLQIGKFLTLENSIFTTDSLLQKRNGFQPLASLANATNEYITTLNSNLTAIGTSVNAYASGTNTWVSKGSIMPLSLSTLPLIRNSLNQTQCDAAVASNGYVCTVYTEVNSGNYVYKYVVADSSTGQNIIQPTLIAASGSPRVFVAGNYFVVMYTNGTALKYFSMPVATPSVTTTPANIAATFLPSSSPGFDAVTIGTDVYITYSTAGGVKVDYLTNAQIASGAVPTHSSTFAAEVATMFSICSDGTTVYVIYYDSVGKTVRTLGVTLALATQYAPTAWFTAGSLGLANIASSAQSGTATALFEVNATYSYDSSIHTNFLQRRTVTNAGIASTGVAAIRGMGLASKGFLIGTTMYVLGTYSTNATDFTLATSVISSYQPTYFLIDATNSVSSRPVVIAKVAYENGGGYLTTGLPSVSVSGNNASISYLIKDLVTSVNKNTNVASGQQIAGVYSQTGINLVNFDIEVTPVCTAEVSSTLHISGGFLWQYDGYVPVEHGFLLYPENIEATYVAGATFARTGTWSSGSNLITLNSVALLAPGMTITGTNIPAGAYILAINGSVATISANTTGSGAATAVSIQSNVAAKPDGSTNTNAYYYQVTYEWTDNQGYTHRSAPSVPVAVSTSGAGADGFVTVHVPTLRVTYKVDNPVKIAIYRWSVEQQAYFEVTSVTYVIQNDTTIDQIQFIDTQSDANIIGNALLYTTGGIVENIAPPATNIMTLFDNRLWTLSAENQNLLNYSKQVIEAVPVEMSDLFTYFVAPNIGTQGNTGPVRALGAMDDKLIVFKENAIYYINGSGPDNTGTNNQYSQPIFITASVGCVNQSSVVLTPNGIMFQSDKGIWMLKRDMSIEYAGNEVEAYNDLKILSATNIPQTTQVRFTLESNVTLIYDYYYDQWGTFTGLSAIASCIYSEAHTYLDSAGAVYKQDPSSYADNLAPVLLSFTTAWISAAGLQGYERFYELLFEGKYITPFTLSVSIYYDYDETTPDTFTITPSGSTVFETRLFPTRQKCETFKIKVQEVQTTAGEGFNMSGLNMVVGIKKGNRTQNASDSFGS